MHCFSSIGFAMRPRHVVFEDQVWLDDPCVIHVDGFSRDTVVCHHWRESIAEVVAIVNAVGEICKVPVDAMSSIELVIDSGVIAVVVIGSRRIGEEIVQVA